MKKTHHFWTRGEVEQVEALVTNPNRRPGDIPALARKLHVTSQAAHRIASRLRTGHIQSKDFPESSPTLAQMQPTPIQGGVTKQPRFALVDVRYLSKAFDSVTELENHVALHDIDITKVVPVKVLGQRVRIVE